MKRARFTALALGATLLSGCPRASRTSPAPETSPAAAVTSALPAWETYDASFAGCAGG